MRVIIHVSNHNSWEPVSTDVTVTPQDVAAGRVRPAAQGGFLMRVPRKGDTHVETTLAEHTIIAQIIRTYTDKGKQAIILTRAEAVAEYLASEVVPHWTNRKHMKHIEVHDDGPSEELFRAMIAPHLEADHGRAQGKNIDAEDVDDLVKAYMTPPKSDHAEHHHVEGSDHKHGLGQHAHLHRHFKLKAHIPDTSKLTARAADRKAAQDAAAAHLADEAAKSKSKEHAPA